MRVVPSHQEIQDLLPAAALDVLEPAELADVMDHLRGCAACAQLRSDYGDGIARLSLLLPLRPSNPARAQRARARLLARAHADRHSTGSTSPGFTAGMRRAGGWMVAAALAGVVLIHHAVHRPIAYGWLAAGILSVVLVGLGVYARIQRRRVAELERRMKADDGSP